MAFDEALAHRLRDALDTYDDALSQTHARPMDFTGRPLTGFVYVAAAGIRTEEVLQRWVERGANFALSLPPK